MYVYLVVEVMLTCGSLYKNKDEFRIEYYVFDPHALIRGSTYNKVGYNH